MFLFCLLFRKGFQISFQEMPVVIICNLFLFTDTILNPCSIMQDECISDFCDMIHVDQICLMASVETWNAAMHLFNSRKAV